MQTQQRQLKTENSDVSSADNLMLACKVIFMRRIATLWKKVCQFVRKLFEAVFSLRGKTLSWKKELHEHVLTFILSLDITRKSLWSIFFSHYLVIRQESFRVCKQVLIACFEAMKSNGKKFDLIFFFFLLYAKWGWEFRDAPFQIDGVGILLYCYI